VFSAAGALGEPQRERLNRLLREARAAARPALLAVHHPPLPGMAKRRKALADAGPLAALIAEHQVPVTVCGHLHRNLTRQQGTARIFATSSASSMRDAAYRVFEWERVDAGWRIATRLRTRDALTGHWMPDECTEWTVTA